MAILPGDPSPVISKTASPSASSDIGAGVSPSLSQPKPKDAWDKADILGKLLGSILIPVGLAATGYYVNAALQDRAAKEKTAEIAVTVLQSSDTSIPELKIWARKVFNETLAAADQPLPVAAQHELESTPLPSGSPPPKAAVDLVAQSEGVSLKPYMDSVGTWTIGFGHTQGVTADTPPITMEQAKALLVSDLSTATSAINSAVKVPLSLNQKSALIDLVRNIGAGPFRSSSLLGSINARQFDKVPEGFMKWTTANVDGHRVQIAGLVARRKEEIGLWNKPDAPESSP